jgi:membrane-associated phospholipid phosphatase
LLGSPVTRTGLVVPACVALLLGKRRRPALILGVTVSGAGALNTGIKKVVGRRRPRSIIRLRPNDDSFPSGHASGTTAVVGAGAYVLWLLTGRTWITAAAALVGAIVSALVGYSRVSLHRHHTSDVLAGHALGLGCAIAAITVDRKVSRSIRPGVDSEFEAGT